MTSLHSGFSAGSVHWYQFGPSHHPSRRYERIKLSILLGNTTVRSRAAANLPWRTASAGSFILCVSGLWREMELTRDGEVFAVKLDREFVGKTWALSSEEERRSHDVGGRDPFLFHLGAQAAAELRREGTLDLEKLKTAFEVNFVGPLAVTKAMLGLLKQSPAGRIVNVSSGLGSLTRTQNSDPKTSPYATYRIVAYNCSKAALNMQTLLFAGEFAAEGLPIKINSVDPGYTATDLNQHQGTRTVEQGASVPVRLAMLPDDGPTGGFFDENGPVP
jgi:NAD(P)-dependent dehydrogenase (short-subunit alcohol dehydrogenase family)